MGPASAAPPAAAAAAETEEARHHYEAGSRAFSLGDFNKAVEEYKAGFNLKPDPVFLYNIAQSYRLAGDLKQALFFYQSYLNNAPRAPNRKEVEERIARLETQIAEQRMIANAPPNSTKPLPSGAPGPFYGPEPAPAPAPPPVAAPAPVAVVVQQPAPVERKPLYKKWWLWAAVGGVAVGVALGVGLGIGLAPKPPGSALGATEVF